MTNQAALTRHEKLMIAARYWLLGMAENDARYFKVIEAMEFAGEHHDGTRNGGDPEFTHQLGIFHQLRTLHKHLRNPVTVYVLVFLHDVIEDPNQHTKAYVNPSDISDIWGAEIQAKVLKMSKNILGQANPKYSLTAIFDDEDCGPAKGGDRVNNVSTMVGVFKPARLKRYIIETAEEFLPRLKTARRKFPHQEAVYENIKLALVNQLTLINHIVELEGTDVPVVN
jgi:(p)ppGpp synthase/HD superfamily hydrolase